MEALMKLTKMSAAVVATLGFLVGGTAVAAPASISAGATLDNSSGQLFVNDSLANIITSESNSFLSNTGSFSGEVYSYVTVGDTNNPYGAGALTFSYFFHNDATSTDSIERASFTGFGNYDTTVAYTTYYTDTPFQRVTRSTSGFGDVIGADYSNLLGGGGIAPGTSFDPAAFGQLVVYTNATAYGQGVASFIDGGVDTAAVFAPIPEPESYAMLLAGLALLGFVARRRRQA